MKKYIQIIAALALTLVIIGLATGPSVWAGSDPNAVDFSQTWFAPIKSSGGSLSEPTAITVTTSGSYSLAGICTIDITYKGSGLQDDIDVEVPVEFSRAIPFGYDGELFLPGCHIVHHKQNNIVREANADDGSWKVCFAERPDVSLTIYHYYDDPGTDAQVWLKLDTTHENGLACAAAPYTGQYAPGNNKPLTPSIGGGGNVNVPAGGAGSVVTPPSSVLITKSGTYSAGGICSLEVLYKEPDLKDELHVADALLLHHDAVDGYDQNGFAQFPDNAGLIYYPGCHVLHYELDKIYQWQIEKNKGDWKICFAARPDKENTIYYYLGDLSDQVSPWEPLDTTTEGGLACAPAHFTGVYVPTGK